MIEEEMQAEYEKYSADYDMQAEYEKYSADYDAQQAEPDLKFRQEPEIQLADQVAPQSTETPWTIRDMLSDIISVGANVARDAPEIARMSVPQVAQGLTFGFSDEIVGGLEALPRLGYSAAMDDETMSLPEAYAQGRDVARARVAEGKQKMPFSSGALDIGSSMLTGGAAYKALGAAPGIARNIGLGTLEGAALHAGTTGKRADEITGMEMLGGMSVGALGGAFGHGLTRWFGAGNPLASQAREMGYPLKSSELIDSKALGSAEDLLDYSLVSPYITDLGKRKSMLDDVINRAVKDEMPAGMPQDNVTAVAAFDIANEFINRTANAKNNAAVSARLRDKGLGSLTKVKNNIGKINQGIANRGLTKEGFKDLPASQAKAIIREIEAETPGLDYEKIVNTIDPDDFRYVNTQLTQNKIMDQMPVSRALMHKGVVPEGATDEHLINYAKFSDALAKEAPDLYGKGAQSGLQTALQIAQKYKPIDKFAPTDKLTSLLGGLGASIGTGAGMMSGYGLGIVPALYLGLQPSMKLANQALRLDPAAKLRQMSTTGMTQPYEWFMDENNAQSGFNTKNF